MPPNAKELVGQVNIKGDLTQLKEAFTAIYRAYEDRSNLVFEILEAGIIEPLSQVLTLTQDQSVLITALKVVNLLSVSVEHIANESRRGLMDSLLGPLTSLAHSSKEDPVVASCLSSLRNFVMSEDGAVRFMLIGGIRTIMEVIHRNNEDVIQHALATLANSCLTETVRNLVSQILHEKLSDTKHLINLCTAKNISMAFFATVSVSILLLSESNIPLLRGLRAIDRVREFVDRDPDQEGMKLFYTREVSKRYSLLLNSHIPEVVCLFWWFAARFSSLNSNINPNEAEMLIFWRGDMIDYLRHFSRSNHVRSRQLAKITLKNINDFKFSKYSNLEDWLVSIEVSDSKEIAKKLKKSDVDMDLLLDENLKENQLDLILDSINIGAALKIKLSLLRLKEDLSIGKKDVKTEQFQVKQKLKQGKEEKEEKVEKDKNKIGNVDVFISYSWDNKAESLKIRDFLESQGLKCWLDETMMSGGEILFEEIDNGVSNARVIVACVSNSYASSENCRREVRLAADRGKIIVPVIVGETKPWPPRGEMGPLLAGKLYVDLSSDEKFTSSGQLLVRALQRTCN